MRILRNHILHEYCESLVFTLFLILFAFLLGRGLVQMADLIFNKQVDMILILKLLYYSLPFILIFVIPMAVLLTTLLIFGKLSLDNEIMAMRASGVSLYHIAKPLLVVVFLLCLVSFELSDKVASVSHFESRKLMRQIGMQTPTAALEEGTFIKKFKNFVIFIYEIDKNELKGVRIYQPQDGRPTRTIVAQRGEVVTVPSEGLIKLRLINGTSDEPDPKDPSKLYKLNFKTYDLPLNISEMGKIEELGKKPKDMTIRELRAEIARLGKEGIKATFQLSAEIHNKYAMAFSSFAFLLIGIPLGITTRRSEKSVNFGIALALMTLYWVLLLAGKGIAQKGLLPPFIALQISNFVIGGLGLVLFTRLSRK